ncbi:MAG: hypothetical protein GF344_09595 [Chitinivibrionales bacterium]|nr:hypothetical protein [Chitinivibrionales bacterium]MBD3357095.1 hypothetical protein [Chitinivibrionales bacterium]
MKPDNPECNKRTNNHCFRDALMEQERNRPLHDYSRRAALSRRPHRRHSEIREIVTEHTGLLNS